MIGNDFLEFLIASSPQSHYKWPFEHRTDGQHEIRYCWRLSSQDSVEYWHYIVASDPAVLSKRPET